MVRTWRERCNDFLSGHITTTLDIERAMQAEIDDLRVVLKEIAAMKPSEISPGFKHGPALLLSNCQRLARRAIRK